VFVGVVTYVETSLDGADRETYLEIGDGRIELRDCYVSLSYSGVINAKKIIVLAKKKINLIKVLQFK
jgi:hypothetical protein